MKKVLLLTLVLPALIASAQSPVTLSSLNRYTYTEDFSDLDNWTFNSSANGTFTNGIGAACWKGLPVGGTGAIPNGSKITTPTTSFATSTSGGVQKGAGNLVLLSTGSTDNTSSAAIDVAFNFTAMNAGLISFEWGSINNSTGNRNASLRVYWSTDNVNFTEIPNTEVVNVTNNAATAGTVQNIPLPSALNNASSAIIRFYYINGSGGTTGSRPKICIDNLKITAVPATACMLPQSQPTNLAFNNITTSSIQATFTSAIPSSDSYLVLASVNSILTDLPTNGVTYDVGDNLGDAIVVSTNGTSFTANRLNTSTHYYFFVFAANALCTNGPLYQTANPLTASVATNSGSVTCMAPVNQPTSLSLTSTPNSIAGTFTAATSADENLVIKSLSSSLSSTPLNGKAYVAGDTLGGGIVVNISAANSFSCNGLSPSTIYHFFIFALNNQQCNNGPAYNLQNPLSANIATQVLQPCITPSTQPTGLNLSATNASLNGSFNTAANTESYLIVYSTSSSLSTLPVNGITYNAGATLGNGIVAGNISSSTFFITNLQAGTTYNVFVFANNNVCTGGPFYLTSAPLTDQVTTTTAPVYNYYFGNLHAHSGYSDGNKDNDTYTPADDYAYAKNSMCMDFLGISEHNHAGAGMQKASWMPGCAQAQVATTNNFLALYGMEWGVISSGGHVLVYGVDKLLGWEANNYDMYVAKSDYTGTAETNGTTGLFRFINTWGNNSFAMLAHPGTSDYNGLSQASYNPTADSAVVGVAVESGPAFSTNTSYSNPASSMSFISYYKKLLAKGYHVGPSMDHDNHYTTFGRTAHSRLAVIAPSLNTASFYNAMRQRNFYATEDCDTRVSFTLNNAIMGSELTGSSSPAININVSDPTAQTNTATIKIMKGIPGSGTDATEVASANSNTISFTDNNLQLNNEAYYYADITMDGARSITAPIWYKRTAGNVLAVQLLSFNATKTINHSVNVTWSTTQQECITSFVVERSANGVDFTAIRTMFPVATYQYKLIDGRPLDGLNYYRLKTAAKDGSINYSKIIAINFSDDDIHSFSVYPNPVGSLLQLNLHSPTTEIASIQLKDLFGRTIYTTRMQIQKGTQLLQLPVGSIQAGTYVVSIQLKEHVLSKTIVKL
jgi:hypothetical protein